MNYRSVLSAAVLAALSSSVFAHDDALFMYQQQAPVHGPIVYPPQGTPSLQFPASGISLVSWKTLGDFGSHSSGADCWGYVSPSGREYAIIGLSGGTGFVEVTDPGQAQIIAVLSGPNSLWRDIKVYQDRAYAVSEGGSGIQVFNLSQIDNGVVTLANTVTSGGGTTTATHNVAINETSGFLYRTGGDNHGLRIYSLANKDNPTYVGAWNNRYIHDAQVVTYTSGPFAGREVAFCFSESGAGGGSPRVDILDVTNKSSISTISTVNYSQPVFSHQGWLSPDRNFLYVNDELDEASFGNNTLTRVLNVSNLNSPSQVGTFSSGSSAIDHNLYTTPGFIFEANYRSGLRVFGTSSSQTNPTQVAWFDTYPDNDGAEFNGLWNAYPYLPSGTIIGSDLEKGLFVWRMGDPQLSFAFPNLTDLINPNGHAVQVQVLESAPGDLATSTVTLHYNAGSGFNQLSMNSIGGGLFQANLPSFPCGTGVEMYVSAQSTNGITWTEPQGAPAYLYGVTAATTQALLIDENMESDPGWTVGAAGDSATTGIWTRVDPIGTSAQPSDDHSEPGTLCWVTGQGPIGGSVGDNDVDNGKTTLTTSLINLSSGDATISYWRWFANSGGASPGEDVFRIDISNNGGGSWTNVETVGPTGNEVVGGWIQHAFTVSDFVTPTGQIRLRFVAEDAGSGSIVEAAIDDFQVLRYDCAAFCQADIGFGGPGNMSFSICGQPLNTGGSATMSLTGAPGSSTALLVIGAQSNPTPLLGGTLVPVPILTALSLFTNPAGEIQLTVPGGGGPATVYLQFIVASPSQPLGVELSNALQVQLGL